MRLIHDHVRKIGRAKTGIVPGIGVRGAQDAETVWEGAFRRELASIGIALVAARALTHHPKAIGIAVPCYLLEAGPIVRALGKQPVIRLLVVDFVPEGAVKIYRLRTGRPDAERSAVCDEVGAAPRVTRNVLLRQHLRSLVAPACRGLAQAEGAENDRASPAWRAGLVEATPTISLFYHEEWRCAFTRSRDGGRAVSCPQFDIRFWHVSDNPPRGPDVRSGREGGCSHGDRRGRLGLRWSLVPLPWRLFLG